MLGPILGGQICPKKALSFLNLKYRIYEVVRSILLFFSTRLAVNSIISIKKASLVITGNNETLKLVSKIRVNRPTILLSAAGVTFSGDNNFNVVKNNELKLLWVGLLIHRKNFGFLIKCLEELPPNINWKMTVAGVGNLQKYWENKTKSGTLKNKINFVGEIEHSNISKFYKESDIFLFPSLREGSPTVILEAMYHQVPVIAFRQNGADIMLNDECGILIPIKNKEQMNNDFVNSIIKLYENPDRRIEMGKAARKKIEENFLWERRGIIMNNLYEQYITNG